MNLKAAHWVAGATSLLIVIAAFLPWASALGFISVSGIDGDGVITLILGLLAIGGVAMTAYGKRWAGWAVAVFGFAVAIIGIIDWADVAGTDGVSTGAGVVLTTLAGVALVPMGLWVRNKDDKA